MSATEPGELSRLQARLDDYPRHPSYVMPTKFGNLLRAAETYGTTQYGIDTVLLWDRLIDATGNQTRTRISETRTALDFYLGFVILGPLYSLAAAATGIAAGTWSVLPSVIAGPLVCVAAHRGACRAARPYGNAIRCLADTARLPLAAKLGLRRPSSNADERDLWRAVSDLIAWGRWTTNSAAWIAVVDAARREHEGGTGAAQPVSVNGTKPALSGAPQAASGEIPA